MAPPNHHDTSLSDGLSLRGLIEEAELLAEAIVDTVRESLLVLDHTLSVRLASRSFYMTFHVSPEETLDHSIYELGNGQWNIPGLRELLEEILPHNSRFCDFEVDHEFVLIGRRIMVLNARKLRRRDDQEDLILLAIEDVTERKKKEEHLREREQNLSVLLREKQTLVQETHHRVKNNLQMIVSLLNLHARQADDPRAAEALSEAGGRVEAIARLHETLYSSEDLAEINFGEYLQQMTRELERVEGRKEITVQVFTDDNVLGMDTAMPLGLIANELILNCFKHAFPLGRQGLVTVAVEYVRDSVGLGESLPANIQI